MLQKTNTLKREKRQGKESENDVLEDTDDNNGGAEEESTMASQVRQGKHLRVDWF